MKWTWSWAYTKILDLCLRSNSTLNSSKKCELSNVLCSPALDINNLHTIELFYYSERIDPSCRILQHIMSRPALCERAMDQWSTWKLRDWRTLPRLAGFTRERNGPSSVPAYLSDVFSTKHAPIWHNHLPRLNLATCTENKGSGVPNSQPDGEGYLTIYWSRVEQSPAPRKCRRVNWICSRILTF